MSKYRKFVVAAAAFLLVLGKVLSDGVISPDEVGALVVAAGTAAGVWAVPNEQ